MDGDDEKRRLKAECKAREQRAMQVAMPLNREQLSNLLAHLEDELERTSCDHSLRLTRAWVGHAKLPEEQILAGLRHFSGYCDCEVLNNVNPEEIFGVLPRR